MIGFEYKGQVAYITRMDDFRDYMEPEVYEAVRKAFENGCDGGLRQKCYRLNMMNCKQSMTSSKIR